VAFLAENAVVAQPVLLELRYRVLGTGKTVGMEALAAQVAAQEILLVAERSTQIAHLLKNQTWIIETYPHWALVPAFVFVV